MVTALSLFPLIDTWVHTPLIQGDVALPNHVAVLLVSSLPVKSLVVQAK